MSDPKRFRGHDLTNPAEYPARYEMSWLRRRSRRVIARTVLVLVVFAVFVFPLGWQGALVAAFLAGVLHLAYFWRRHQTATAWHKEGYAERQSVRVLLPLEKQGYLVLHDHHHEGFQIQTLLIGAPGVWLVHAVGRAPLRRLWGNAAFLHPEKQPTPTDPAELRDHASAVSETLTAEAGETVSVRPVYLAIGDDLPESVDTDGAVPVVGKGRFPSFLAGEPARLSADAVEKLAAVAAAALPAGHGQDGSPSLPPMAVKKSLWSRRRGLEFRRETEVGDKRRPQDR